MVYTIYVTGTHSSLAQEPMTMFQDYLGPTLSLQLGDPAFDDPVPVRFEPFYEVIDGSHCQFFSGTQKCKQADDDSFVGFQKLSEKYFEHQWGDTLISDYFEFEKELR